MILSTFFPLLTPYTELMMHNKSSIPTDFAAKTIGSKVSRFTDLESSHLAQNLHHLIYMLDE